VPFADPKDDDRGDTMEQPEATDDDPLQKLVARDNEDDMATYLSAHMRWYIEYPHVDSAFVAVYHAMPGFKVPEMY